MKLIEDFLRETMGLHATNVGASLVAQAAQARMRQLGVALPDVYLQLLRGSQKEWRALVEAVVVTETWFFRDPQAFRALAHFAHNEWLPAHRRGQLRLLSVPCSTGEEPYSMAMALLDSGFPEARFHIDAADISTNAVAKAGRAEYGKNSFRGKDLKFRARHFTPNGKLHTLNAAVRKKTRFQIGNILDEKCLAVTGAYDFIFCRNLLIYFDRPTQQKVLMKLRRLLATNGVLFLGSAELPIAIENGFASVNAPMSFACRASNAVETGSRQAAVVPVTPGGGTSRKKPAPDLARARELAEKGSFAEAVEICELLLRESGPNAEAYYLLGLLRDAEGEHSQAGEFYRKALYLKPDHYETLVRWAELKQRSGDNKRARLLKSRAERIKHRP